MRGRKKRIVKVSDRVDATPETVANLRPDILQAMVTSGFLDSAHEKAADEISLCVQAITQVVSIRNRDLSDAQGGAGDIPDWLDFAYTHRYLPWCRSHRVIGVDVRRLAVDHEAPRFPKRCKKALSDYARLMLTVHPV